MSEATQTQTLEQTLNKTDLGHTLYEHRKLFFGALIAILVGATGFLLWKQNKQAAARDTSVKVFEFQNSAWSDAKAGKTDAASLVKAFESLDEAAQTAPVMVPLILDMAKFLYDKGNFSEADAVLSKVSGKVSHPVPAFFLAMQRAVVLEKLGKIDEAIAVLEPIAQQKDGMMPAKTSIELGRLYLLKGEKGKAQTQFDYVTSTFPNDEHAKLAKLYLQQLTK